MNVECDNSEFLIISVKPKFAKKIFSGEKTVELRKSAPQKIKKGSLILIYVTFPVKELWGFCEIDIVLKETPAILWKKVGRKSGLSKDEFFNYYNNSKNAYGIEISNAKFLSSNSVKLSYLKKILPGFTPPQTYKYIERTRIEQDLFL